MNMPRIIALGAFPPPRTGQSVVTEVVCAALERQAEVVRIDASRGMRAWRSGLQGALRRFLAWIGAIRDLRAAMKEGADVVYFTPAASRMGTLRDVVALLVMGRGRKIVAHVHAGSMGAHLERSRVARWTARRCDRILVPSEYVAAAIRTSLPDADVRVAYNPIAPELRLNRDVVEAKWERNDLRPPSILFLANMIPGKGYGDLISAVSRLKSPVRVVLAGEWSDNAARMRLQGRLDTLGVAEQIYVTGALSVEEVRDALLDATLLVHPSRLDESASLVVVEGMAAGCAIVASDHTGCREMVQEAGVLVAPGDIDGLAAAIDGVLEDPTGWGKRARVRYEEDFDPESLETTIVENILSVFSAS